MRCNVDVKFMIRGISQEMLHALLNVVNAAMPDHQSKKRRLVSKTKIVASRLAGMFAVDGKDTHSQMKAVVVQMILDTIRDQMDAQHYVGEYATKKFEAARDLLPELYKGLMRLERQQQVQAAPEAATQPAGSAAASADLSVEQISRDGQVDDHDHQLTRKCAADLMEAPVSVSVAQMSHDGHAEIHDDQLTRDSAANIIEVAAASAPPAKNTAQECQSKARQTLMRLATSMQRCLSKSKGEMTFQILFESEAFLTFQTYKLFTKFPIWAVLECQHDAACALHAANPRAVIQSLQGETQQQPGAESVSLHDAIIEAQALQLGDQEGFALEDKHKTHHTISLTKVPNQKDDYTHRGNHPVLTAMSIYIYSRCVRRIIKGPATLQDDQQFFQFNVHYALHGEWIQELRCKDIMVELSGLTIPTQSTQPQKNNAFKLALFSPHKPCDQTSYCNKCVHHELWQCHTTNIVHQGQEGDTTSVITSTFIPHWKICYCRMRICYDRAQERRMGAMKLPSVKDVIGQRHWFAASDDQMCAAFASHSDLKATLWQWLQVGPKCILTPRLWERICWFLGIKEIGFHYCQLTPEEHFAVVQVPYVQRLELHAEARGCSRDKGDFWKTVMQGPDFNDVVADGDCIEVEEGVPDDMQEVIMDLDDADTPMFPLSSMDTDEAVFRLKRLQQESAKVRKAGKTSSLSKALHKIESTCFQWTTTRRCTNVPASSLM